MMQMNIFIMCKAKIEIWSTEYIYMKHILFSKVLWYSYYLIHCQDPGQLLVLVIQFNFKWNENPSQLSIMYFKQWRIRAKYFNNQTKLLTIKSNGVYALLLHQILGSKNQVYIPKSTTFPSLKYTNPMTAYIPLLTHNEYFKLPHCT
jgi:hypothetical protein